MLFENFRWCPGSPNNKGTNNVWGMNNNCAYARRRSDYGGYTGPCIFDYPCTQAWNTICEFGN